MESIIDALHSSRRVTGKTHTFYRYPARFSPDVAKALIMEFSDEGDVVFDPYCGGGTTLVEAVSMGRHAVGGDISQLATFISKSKLTRLSSRDRNSITNWMNDLNIYTNMRLSHPDISQWTSGAYLRHMDRPTTWRIRKFIALSIASLDSLQSTNAKTIIRASLLRTSQWALDNSKRIPAIPEIRSYLERSIDSMVHESISLTKIINQLDSPVRWKIYCDTAENAHSAYMRTKFQLPKLILTSPPYPGVHVLYHRWQIDGRNESAVPFWISNCLDGAGCSYYTMGGRHSNFEDRYFSKILTSMQNLRAVCKSDTVVAQIIGFSNPEDQLEKYEEVMSKAGFQSAIHRLDSSQSRVSRKVPNRKWFAESRGDTGASEEFLLLHTPANP